MRKTLLLLLCVAYTGMATRPKAAVFSTSTAHIKMTLALAVATSVGNNKQTNSTVDTDAQTVKFSMKIREFAFDNSLIENAFEESYMEAGKYPDATFSGKLKTSISLKSKTPQKVEVAGDLTLHGIKKPKTFTATVTMVSPTQMKVTSDFTIKASEHKIDISPSMFASGRDDIRLHLSATYAKK